MTSENSAQGRISAKDHIAPTVMGILNVTPDSFSDGGRFATAEAAIDFGRALVGEGAAIIDVGGESTRPGAQPVSEAEELSRVIEVVEALSDVAVVSIDTRHARVARAAVAAGATILNDVGAALGAVAADLGVGWVAMHSPAEPAVMGRHPGYADVVAEVTRLLTTRAVEARRSGARRVWIDPGIGFGKDLDANLDLLASLEALVASGWPVALGTSRKSSLGVLAGRADRRADPAAAVSNATDPPPDDRLEGSLATALWAAHCGVDLLRVHDVADTVAALDAAGFCITRSFSLDGGVSAPSLSVKER